MDRSVVLVTGASRGLGQAVAALLAGQGYRVFGTARKPSAGGVDGVRMLPLDVTSEDSVSSCVSRVMDRAGRIDVLVNNAAVGLIGAIEETPVEDAAALFDTNLFGTARMVNAVLPDMRRRRSGLIINLGSLAPAVPAPFHAYLSASKAAVNTFTDALRLEIRDLGIAVTVVEPGAMATHLTERFTRLRVRAAIGDYAENETRATGVYQRGQQAGADPQTVARTILRIIRTPAPARYYLVGSEKWYARLSRVLPPPAVESLAAHHFQLLDRRPSRS
jgi:short-subunit dehydrogenase